MDFANYWFSSGSGGGGGYQIGESLRFREGATESLQFSPTVASGGMQLTMSCWYKGSGPETQNGYLLWTGGRSNINGAFGVGWTNGAKVQFFTYRGSSNQKSVDRALRDPSAWYHIIVAIDRTQADAAQRERFWINGVEQTNFNPNQVAGQNNGILFGNVGNPIVIGHGRNNTGAVNGDLSGYLAEYHCVDGTQITDPTTFGEFNADGVWAPIDVTGLDYGTNGFYLDFSDPTDIGADRSGNGNNFTPTGFELTNTNSTNYDWMADSPTSNVPTWNPVSFTTKKTYADANRELSIAGQQSAWTLTESQLSLHKPTGRQVIETAFAAYYSTSYNKATGINIRSNGSNNIFAYWQAAQATGNRNRVTFLDNSLAVTTTWPTPGGTNTGQGSWFGLFYDGTTGDLWPCVNNTNNEATAATWNPQWLLANGTFSTTMPGTAPYNFPDAEFFFAGLNNQNGGGAGPYYLYGHSKYEEFEGSLPAGFEFASCSSMENVPITNPSDHFRIILDTGANILTNAQAQVPNGLWWIKDRANSNNHQLVDSVSGTGGVIWSPSTQFAPYSAPTGNSIAWCWDGSAPATTGFEIITYTGSSSAQNISHNLGAPPEWRLVCRRATCNKIMYHVGAGNNRGVYFNDTGSVQSSGYWDNTTPNASTFRVGTQEDVNSNGVSHRAYIWRSVPGYSAFGSYTGNNSTDGPFIYTGFRPRFIWLRAFTGSGSLITFDTAVSPHNVCNRSFYSARDWAESSQSQREVDLLSNGFKLRNSFQEGNEGYQYCWAAFAEHPCGGGNVSPSPAR